jgi:hypothetical protein
MQIEKNNTVQLYSTKLSQPVFFTRVNKTEDRLFEVLRKCVELEQEWLAKKWRRDHEASILETFFRLLIKAVGEKEEVVVGEIRQRRIQLPSGQQFIQVSFARLRFHPYTSWFFTFDKPRNGCRGGEKSWLVGVFNPDTKTKGLEEEGQFEINWPEVKVLL